MRLIVILAGPLIVPLAVLIMAGGALMRRLRGYPFVATAAIVVSLTTAPAVHAEHWHGGRHYEHHGGGSAAGAAIIGGLVGLGVGAAIASSGGYYPPPPPVYYGGVPPAYYAPPPPVYYGYGY